MNITIAPLKGVETKGLRILSVGGLMLASLGVCAAADAAQEQRVEQKTAKKEVVTEVLAPTTIIANRAETDVGKVGSSVSILDTKELGRQGIRELDDALKFVPGVISDTSSGQRGTNSNVYIRGNQSSYTGVIVDGIRMGGTSFKGGNFWGTGNLLGTSRIEVLKGPQGVLYGANSMSGVVGISNEKGAGDFTGDLRVEGGSFNSWNTMLGMQGETGKLSYSLSLGYESTDNDLPNNEFEAFSYALRLDYAVSECLRLGLTLRGIDSQARLPKYNDPAYSRSKDINFDYSLSTIFAEYDVNDVWSSKWTLGYYDETYDVAKTARLYTSESDKLAAYWDNTLTWNDQHTTVAGFAYEQSKYKNLTLDQNTRDQYALYANHIWSVTDNFNVTGGLRWESYSDDVKGGFNGDVTTWRVASSYTVEQSNSIIRASIGSGFQLPTFYEVYGNSPSVNELDPVESLGWDLGIEQPFCDGQYKLGVTYFATRVDDAILWKVNPLWAPVYENVEGVTETSGVEAFAQGYFFEDRVSAIFAYTWLDRQALPSPHFLAEHTFSLRIDTKVSDQLNLGLTSTYQGDRALYGSELDAYALVNVYANYKVNENISLIARVDNLLDKDYYYGISGAAEDNIKPGRGLGFFGGVTLSW